MVGITPRTREKNVRRSLRFIGLLAVGMAMVPTSYQALELFEDVKAEYSAAPARPLQPLQVTSITASSDAALTDLAKFSASFLFQCKAKQAKALETLDASFEPLSLQPKLDHEAFLETTPIGRERLGDKVNLNDYTILNQVLQKVCRGAIDTFGSCTTLETGFALAGSAISILDAHQTAREASDASSEKRSIHFAVDPLQAQLYSNVGARSVSRYFRDHPGHMTDFYLVNETAALGLSQLAKENRCVDVIFLDDGHRFEQNIMELALSIDILTIGGVIVMHDMWMGSIKATINWIESNLGGVVRLVKQNVSHNMAVMVKVASDNRKWDHFVGFSAQEANHVVRNPTTNSEHT